MYASGLVELQNSIHETKIMIVSDGNLYGRGVNWKHLCCGDVWKYVPKVFKMHMLTYLGEYLQHV